MVLVSVTYRAQRAGVCLMRTQNLDDPKSWRAWDGDGLQRARFIDPYRESGEPVTAHVCEPMANGEIGELNRSITYNTFLDKYVAVGTSQQVRLTPAGQLRAGVLLLRSRTTSSTGPTASC